MNDKRLINQLKSLQAIAPSVAWREQNRRFLLSQVKSETEPVLSASRRSEWQNYARWFGFKIPQLVVRPVGIVILAGAIVLGSGVFVVSAAGRSLPGDTLYSIKITSEKVQSSFFTNPDDVLALEISFANRRLDEMKKINQCAESTEKKQARVAQATNVLTQNLKNIQSNLDAIKNKGGSSSKVVAAASSMDSQVTQLNEAAGKESSATTTEVKGLMSETFNKTLDTMTEQYQNGRLDYQAKEEILKIINVTIDQTSEKIRLVLADLEACCLPAVEAGQDKPEILAELGVEASKAEIKQKLSQASGILVESKKAMTTSDVVLAVSKIKQSKDLINLVEQQIVAIEQSLITAAEDKMNEQAGAVEETVSITAVSIDTKEIKK